MDNRFFEQPILNFPYTYPARHWELDEQGQPTQKIIENRRPAKFITPIPKPRKRQGKAIQQSLFALHDFTSQTQQYDPTSIINELRRHVDQWLEIVNRKLGLSRVLDLSATPFFLSGSGYAEGTLFPWTMSDFSLMDAEYADVLGIPFDFTAKPVVAPPQPPRETVQVKAVRPDRDHLEIRFPRVAGYRVELPEERLSAEFNDDSVLELSPDIVGPSITRNAGIIGEAVDLSLKHLEDMRRSTLLFHLTQRLLYTKWRDPFDAPKLHLFGQLKRITKQWLDTCLVCKGSTYPAQLMYQELADMACERITAAITRAEQGNRPIKAVLDPYNPAGSTSHVNFNTSRKDRWQTDARHCHINWVVLDSGWEAEFCRVAESHPKVKAYVKNHNLGLEVPYRFGAETRAYIPDFIVMVDDGHEDPLHLIVEIKGYRREDAKEKKSTMETYWVPGVNNLERYGRWAFAEFTEVYRIESDFEARVKDKFNQMIGLVTNHEG